MDRRRFIVTVGKGALAVGVLGVTACAGDGEGGSTSATPGTSTGAPVTTQPPGSTTDGATTTTAAAGGDLVWERASFGFVSAYVLARAGGATVVDTGMESGEVGIEEALAALDLGWGDVGHIVLTHHHQDHVGSLGAVAERATTATLYGGEADIASIAAPRGLIAVGDGSEVMGLTVIETPGHTAGSISILDPGAGVLVVGDALSGADDGASVTGSNPQFTDDMAQAEASVAKLAGYRFKTILFGHGEPVLTGGATLLADYAASLAPAG